MTMFGLDYVVAGYAHLVAAGAGQIKCEIKKSPEIAVVASDTTLKINHSKSQGELGGFDIDTVSPYAADVKTHVGGLMSGEISTSSQMRIATETYDAFNAGCLMVDKIEVKIHVDPTIFIAREIPKDSCMYREVMIHERKHVQVDREIINKYTKIIVHSLDATFKKIGYAQGPFTKQAMKAKQEEMGDIAAQIVKAHSDNMNIERKARQQAVDSLEEYNRVNDACKGRR